MQKAAEEFLNRAGMLYEENRVKWRSMLKKKGLKFSDDIYGDSIIKTYDAIMKREVDGTDYMGYWYRTFLNNSKRDLDYSYHKRDEDVDVFELLKDKEYVEYKDNSLIIRDLVCTLSDKDTILLRMHYELEIPYEVIEGMTGVKDVRRYIKRLLEKVNNDEEKRRNVKSDSE